MMNCGLLMNKSSASFRDASFECASCKMGKSKILSFPTHNGVTTDCFDLIHSDVQGIDPYCFPFTLGLGPVSSDL